MTSYKSNSHDSVSAATRARIIQELIVLLSDTSVKMAPIKAIPCHSGFNLFA